MAAPPPRPRRSVGTNCGEPSTSAPVYKTAAKISPQNNEDFFLALYEEAHKIPGLRSLAYHPDGSKLLLNGRTWDAGHVEFRNPYGTLAEAVDAEAPELAA
jgi:hypothetical protein